MRIFSAHSAISMTRGLKINNTSLYKAVGRATNPIIIPTKELAAHRSQGDPHMVHGTVLCRCRNLSVCVDKLTVLCESLQRTYLQRPLLRTSPTAGEETSRGRNPENGRRRDFGRRGYSQSGFQYTYGPRPSSPELFNKNHNAGRESLSHLS